MRWCSIISWLEYSNDVINFVVVHQSEKRTRAISLNSISRFVDIPVPKFAHGILESAEPVDIYLWINKQINIEFFTVVTTRVKGSHARRDWFPRTALGTVDEGINDKNTIFAGHIFNLRGGNSWFRMSETQVSKSSAGYQSRVRVNS